MQLDWTEEQQAKYAQCVEFASNRLDHDVTGMEKGSEFPKTAWRRCAEFGALGWYFPKEYGGSGYDLMTSVYMLEGIGYGCADNGLTLAINGQLWSIQQPLLEFGSELQKEKFQNLREYM